MDCNCRNPEQNTVEKKAVTKRENAEATSDDHEDLPGQNIAADVETLHNGAL